MEIPNNKNSSKEKNKKTATDAAAPSNFIRTIIDEDLKENKNEGSN